MILDSGLLLLGQPATTAYNSRFSSRIMLAAAN